MSWLKVAVQQREGSPQLRVAGNFMWNMLGGCGEVLLALLYVPYLIHGLGKEAYGIYAILAVLLAYFRFLDLGFSRSLEKYGAEAIGSGRPDLLPEYFATAFWLQLIIGALATSLLWNCASFALSFLNIAEEYRTEAVAAFRLAAIGFGFFLAAGAPAGAIRALQRFQLLNGIGIVVQTLAAGLLVGAVSLQLGLRGVMWALLIKSVVHFALLLCWSISLLGGRVPLTISPAILAKQLRFGGFLTLSGAMTAVLVNAEKALMGALLSMEAVTYYMVPYKLASAISLLPGALSNALFPYLNVLEGRHERMSMYRANWRTTELLAWSLLPLLAMVWIAGDELLRLWIDPEFAVEAGPVLKVLASGFFVNALAWNSLALIQARGRPELPFLFYMVEMIFYVPLAYLLMRRMGVLGAAWAWFARVGVDTVLMWTFASRLAWPDRQLLPPLHWKAVALAGVVIVASLYLGRAWALGMESLLLGVCVAAILIGLGWFGVLDASERNRLPKVWLYR